MTAPYFQTPNAAAESLRDNILLYGQSHAGKVGDLFVGNNGNGVLNIQEGGSVTIINGLIAANAGSIGEVNVTGTGSIWNVGENLYVGGSSSAGGGTGLLTIDSGGTVNVAGLTHIYAGSMINVGPGGSLSTFTFENDGSLNVASGGTFNTSNLLAPGQLSNNGDLHGNVTIQSGGTFAGTGTIAGNLTLADGSTYAPANSPGIQQVYGDVTWNTMSYSMQITDATGAPGAGYDSLAIHAAGAALGQLNIVAGSTVEVDIDEYPAGNPIANFNNLSPFDLGLVSTEGGITGFDTATFSANPSAYLQGTLGGGFFSIVESPDLMNLLVHFTPGAVPEPGTLALVGLVALGLRWRLRRRHERPAFPQPDGSRRVVNRGPIT